MDCRSNCDRCYKIWSGSIVDRLNKRSIMLITDIIRAALIGCVPLFDSIWAIYMFIFLTRIAASFFDPASFTYKTMLIPAEKRAQFNAWNSFLQTELYYRSSSCWNTSPRTQHPL